MNKPDATPPSHFLRQIVQADLDSGKHNSIVTRFPPEPNGYLHIGHAKSICLNFGIAESYQGACHLRFDDTNPEKEEDEYIQSIKQDVEWLGFEWAGEVRFASNYFDRLYELAVQLIRKGLAYVDLSSAEQIREMRGWAQQAGTPSEYREQSPEEALAQFEKRWKDEALVMDQWFSVQASAGGTDQVERVRGLLQHPAFDWATPNRVRSVVGAFAGSNPAAFHAEDGSGYRLFAEMLAKVDALNPQIAARIANAAARLPRLKAELQGKLRAELESVKKGASANLSEVLGRVLSN